MKISLCDANANVFRTVIYLLPWNSHPYDIKYDLTMSLTSCTICWCNRMVVAVWCHSNPDRLCSKYPQHAEDMAIAWQLFSIGTLDLAQVVPIYSAIQLPSSINNFQIFQILSKCVDGEEKIPLKNRFDRISNNNNCDGQVITSQTP